MNISHIDHINIVVRDLVAAKRFFEQLGFVTNAEKDLEGDWIDKTVGLSGVKAKFASLSVGDSGTVIELLQYYSPIGSVDPLLGQPNQIGFRHIAFNVSDIDAWYNKLQEQGIECFSEVQTVPNYRDKKIFYFRGPEGIILEMAEYPKSNG